MTATYEDTYAKCLAAVAPRENASMIGFGHRQSQGTQATVASANERRAADEIAALHYMPSSQDMANGKSELQRKMMKGEGWSHSRAERAIEALAADGRVKKIKKSGKWWFWAAVPTKSGDLPDTDPEWQST